MVEFESPDRWPSTRRSVLLVDDEPDIRALVGEALTERGYDVTEAGDAERALAVFGARPPDLVVLDLGLPGADGLDVLRRIRQTGNIPVIVLSARGDEVDRVAGLEMGADDYVVKPFSRRELVARVGSVLRRCQPAAEPEHVLRFGALRLDLDSRDVWVDDRLVELTAKEFDLLAFLVSSPRRVFSREQLLEHVWASSSAWQSAGTVSEHVHRVRQKLEVDPTCPRWIRTYRGVGYRFEP